MVRIASFSGFCSTTPPSSSAHSLSKLIRMRAESNTPALVVCHQVCIHLGSGCATLKNVAPCSIYWLKSSRNFKFKWEFLERVQTFKSSNLAWSLCKIFLFMWHSIFMLSFAAESGFDLPTTGWQGTLIRKRPCRSRIWSWPETVDGARKLSWKRSHTACCRSRWLQYSHGMQAPTSLSTLKLLSIHYRFYQLVLPISSAGSLQVFCEFSTHRFSACCAEHVFQRLSFIDVTDRRSRFWNIPWDTSP